MLRKCLRTTGAPPGIQELNIAIGQCSGSAVPVVEAVLVVILKIVLGAF